MKDTMTSAELKTYLKANRIKVNKKISHRESELQRACVRWFRIKYPKYAMLLFAIPNGGARSKVEAGIMQAEGVTPGVADLFLASPREFIKIFRTQCHGLFIEMKSGTNKYQSAAQKQFQHEVEKQDYRYAIINSIDGFVEVIDNYLGN